MSAARINFIVILLIAIAPTVAAQSNSADVKMSQIESYKKFTASSDQLSAPDTNQNSDSSIRVLQLVIYTRKKDGLGKVVQRSRYQGTEVKRICYFNEGSKLFGIRDSIWYDNHTTRVLTYYFSAGKLQRVIDSGQNNVTPGIDQTELFDWIKSMFDNPDIE